MDGANNPVQFFSQSEAFRGTVKENENLSSHTTMNVGGPAGLFLEPEDYDSLIFAVQKLTDEKIPFFVLGGGSNVVINDKGLEAVISTRKMNAVEFLTGNIKISGGASWGSVISFCRKNDLGGLEGFTGLSGTAGGALYMNASCFGLSACDKLVSCDYFDLSDLKIHTYKKNAADWAYKKSPFQNTDYTDLKADEGRGVAGSSPQRGERTTKCERGERLLPEKIILSAVFTVHDGFDAAFSEKCMESRREKGHFNSPSSGSAFKNDASKGIVAGKIIDECGLKGFSCGGAQIAPWHANFIVNPERKASASDIKKLSEMVQKTVFEKTGIRLESEIIFV
jgi:UDP-N-acetylmuramate dehydrogenase